LIAVLSTKAETADKLRCPLGVVAQRWWWQTTEFWKLN